MCFHKRFSRHKRFISCKMRLNWGFPVDIILQTMSVFFFFCSFVIELAVVFFTALQLPAMAYRVNGLPPFQVSFSITFPEGYVGKEKMDTKFHVDAEDSQVQAREGCKSAIF